MVNQRFRWTLTCSIVWLPIINGCFSNTKMLSKLFPVGKSLALCIKFLNQKCSLASPQSFNFRRYETKQKWYNGLRRPSRELQATNRRYITSKKFPTFHTLENFNVRNKFFEVRNFWCPKLLAAQKNQSNTFQLFQNVMSRWQNALHWRRMLWEC